MSRGIAAALGLAVAVSLGGCAAQPAPSAPLGSSAPSAPGPRPSAQEPSPVVAALAALEVLGSGHVACMIPHGCVASFVIGPAGWTPDARWEPAPTDPAFTQTLDQKTFERRISGPLENGPRVIAAGRHTLVAAVSERSDLIIVTPDNPSPDPGYLWTETCSLAVDIPADVTLVRVAVVFDGSTCEISAHQN